MKKRVADIVMDTLADLGVDQAFCVVGGGSMYLNNALGISKRIKTIYCHHEQACAMAAEGYAKYKCDRPALVQVTTGPGGTNTLTGVMGAYLDSIPMIVVSGQCRYVTSVPYTGLPLRTRGVQEFDIVNTVKTMTKYSKLILDPLSIKMEIHKAYDIAMNGRRGPVWLDIPLDVQAVAVEEDDMLPVVSKLPVVSCCKSEVEKAMAQLRNARRPCILAGSGIRYSGNHAAFVDFLTRVKVPVVTSASQPDVLERSHPLHVGAEGLTGQRAGNFVLQNADVVFGLGNSFSLRETGWNPELFAPDAEVVSVDVDPFEHKKPDLHVKTFLHCDLRSFFNMTREEHVLASSEWLQYASEVKKSFDPFEGRVPDDDNRVNTYNFWHKYASRVSDTAITCLGNSPSISGWLRCGNIKAGQRTLVNVNCGSMGDDMPLAVGACVASKSPVTLAVGDGSFMMNMQELATIMHNNLPVRIVLFSNGGYNALRCTWKRYFNGVNAGCDKASGISFPEFCKVACSFEMPYRKCAANHEIGASLDWLLGQDGPALLEVMESIDERPNMPCVISRLRPDGTSEPALLQDMSPPIERKRYSELMISKRKEG